jgi:lipase chaperone LimK
MRGVQLGIFAALTRIFKPDAIHALTAAEQRKSAIERERSNLAIDAFLGNEKANRKWGRLKNELEDVNAEINQLREAIRDGELREPVHGISRSS